MRELNKDQNLITVITDIDEELKNILFSGRINLRIDYNTGGIRHLRGNVEKKISPKESLLTEIDI